MIENIVTTYNFTESDNYSFDSDKIQVLNGKAELLPTTGTPEAEIYLKLDDNKGLVAIDSSGNNNHGAFQGGLDENNWVAGKINSAINGISSSNGFINLDQLLDFERTDPFSLECWVKYTGSTTQVFIGKQNNVGNFEGYSMIAVASGAIRFVVRDINGNVNSVETAGLYNDGNFHHIIVVYDGSSVISGLKIYVDNVLDTTISTSGTLDSTIKNSSINLQVSGRNGNNDCILSTTTLDEVVIYARELTAAEVAFRWNNGNGTQILPGAGVSFPTDNPTIQPFASRSATELIDFDATIFETGSDEIKFVLNIDGTDKYWNGSAWVDSSGYSQSNTLAEVKTNISSLTLTNVSLIIVKAYIHSDDGSTTPSIDNMSLSTNLTFNTTGPNITNVFGVSYSPDGSFSQEVFTVQPSIDGIEYDLLNQVRDDIQYIQPEIDGSWSVDLVDNEDAETGTYYIFKFGNRIERKIVPKTTSIEYNRLVDFTD